MPCFTLIAFIIGIIAEYSEFRIFQWKFADFIDIDMVDILLANRQKYVEYLFGFYFLIFNECEYSAWREGRNVRRGIGSYIKGITMMK